MTASVLSIAKFLDKMPQDLQEEFRKDCKLEFMKGKAIHKQQINGQEQEGTYNIVKILVASATK